MNASILNYFQTQSKNKKRDCIGTESDFLGSQLTFKKRRVNKEELWENDENQNTNQKESVKQEEETQAQKKIQLQQVESNIVDFNDEIQFKDEILEWARPDNIKDNNMRRPGEEGYDPTKLHIPQYAMDNLTPAWRQYWEIKSQHYDKLILFKLGKFYELFEEDAVVAAKILDLNFMGGKWRAGFPEHALSKFLPKLVSQGIKVAVVEQTETDKELMERIAKEKPQKHLRILRREMIDVQSVATYIEQEDELENPEFKYMWNITGEGNLIVVLVTNFISNEFQLYQFNELFLEDIMQFKILFTNFFPSEIVKSSEKIPENFMKIIKTKETEILFSVNKQKISRCSLNEFVQACTNKLKISPQQLSTFISVLENLNEKTQEFYSENLLKFFEYLNSILLLDKALVQYSFKIDQMQQEERDFLQINAQTLEHLEIFESSKGTQKYSLFWLVNKCQTNQGQRLLKKWLQKPLFKIEQIKEWQKAIKYIGENKELRLKFQTTVKKVTDVERQFFTLSKYSVVPKQKVIFFYDLSTKKINELFKFFSNIDQAILAIKIFKNQIDKIDSEYIQELLRDIPNVNEIIKQIKSSIEWENNSAYPVRGFSQEFDSIQDQIESINQQVNWYVENLQKSSGVQTLELSKGKYRFELKIEQGEIEKVNKIEDLEFSSWLKNHDKFVTNFLKQKIFDLEHLEDQSKQQLYLFSYQLFAQFNQYKDIWLKISNTIAQLDVVCSLAEFSFQDYMQLTEPVFISKEKSYINANNIKHPVLTFKDSEFIGNDILLNDEQRTIVLTGPNMGGKSTIMRTLATNIILAQIGCHVCADRLEISPIDKIFSRIGASDKLEEHKSTFYVEMEETQLIIKNASQKSLAIIDELGRGTSTFDGYSIAAAVLNHIVQKIDCLNIFATHYQFIQQDINWIEHKLIFKQMDYQLINDEQQDIKFLYKIADGICSQSFAMNVAWLSGIPEQIIQRALYLSNHCH